MDYEVILTATAKTQLDQIIYYILSEFRSEQAALSVMEDADHTREKLAHVVASLKLCDDSNLRALGYRMIHFKYHRYFMLYRIEDDKVYVDAIYHDLQDFEGILQ